MHYYYCSLFLVLILYFIHIYIIYQQQRENMQSILDETYRRQREMVPHSVEDTRRYKELHRLQLEAKKQKAITEKEFVDFHLNQKGFWDRNIKPLFTKDATMMEEEVKDAYNDDDDDSSVQSDASSHHHNSHTTKGNKDHHHRRRRRQSKTALRRQSKDSTSTTGDDHHNH